MRIPRLDGGEEKIYIGKSRREDRERERESGLIVGGLLRHPREPARGLNAIYLGRCCTVAEATAGVTHFSSKIMPVTREDRLLPANNGNENI